MRCAAALLVLNRLAKPDADEQRALPPVDLALVAIPIAEGVTSAAAALIGRLPQGQLR